MRKGLVSSVSIVAMLLAGCGGSGGTGSTPPPTNTLPTPAPAPAPAPAPTPSPTAGCSLTDRKAFALQTIQEWWLFAPQDLAQGVNPASYATVQDYIDALVAPARAQGKDRYFTYITSIAEENAYYNSGSTAGIGVRFALDPTKRLFIAEAFENAPALNAGIDRGYEILAIGTTSGTLRNVSDIVAAEGTAGIGQALGPDDVGVTRIFRVRDTSGNVREVSVAKADYNLLPVSPRYGVKILDNGGTKVGYVNLRTFIGSAEGPLRDAFAQFKAQGITQIVIDLRYNGGGLVRIGDLVGDLLGANRSTTDVLSRTVFRPEKSNNDTVRYFQPQPQSIAPTRVAFIGFGGTASASELVINSQIPYLGRNMALIGGNTYGKPVGQIALDRPACDDRMRVVAFATANAAGQRDYYNGLAGKVPNSCRSGDEIAYQLGDPREQSLRVALDFLAGRTCTPIADAGVGTLGATVRSYGDNSVVDRGPRASTFARENPGAF